MLNLPGGFWNPKRTPEFAVSNTNLSREAEAGYRGGMMMMHQDGSKSSEATLLSSSNRVGGFTKRPLDSIIPLTSSGLTLNAIPGDGIEQEYSRKVFIGGLPPDVDEAGIAEAFSMYGRVSVDWPHKKETKSYFPPKGYAFVIFEQEQGVQDLLRHCRAEGEKYIHPVSSPSIKDKPVQVRPWKLTDADFVMDPSLMLDPRKTIFIGGVPRPLKAHQLAQHFNRLFGGVSYAGVDTDTELKYPKGAGRVAFNNQHSYIAAISARFVQLQGDSEKNVEVKPYVLDDQACDICKGNRCGKRNAPFFCGNVACLQYFCQPCWSLVHSGLGRECHKPLIKEGGADRTRQHHF